MTTNRASARLFGADDLDRTRLVVRTDSETAVDDLLPGAVTAHSAGVHVVDAASYVDDDLPLESLSVALSRVIDEFGASQSHRVGGELRLCVTSVGALLDSYDVAATECFLRRTVEAVAGVRGMGHYRFLGPRASLPIPVDTLFDGFVDLREGESCDGDEHRLSVPPSAATNWVAL